MSVLFHSERRVGKGPRKTAYPSGLRDREGRFGGVQGNVSRNTNPAYGREFVPSYRENAIRAARNKHDLDVLKLNENRQIPYLGSARSGETEAVFLSVVNGDLNMSSQHRKYDLYPQRGRVGSDPLAF